MIAAFEGFVGNKILNHFCLNPNDELNINELAKKLKISSFSAKQYCDLLQKEGFLLVKPVGNQKRFSLNNNSIYVKQVKRAAALLHFREKGLDSLVENVNSFAIYGSFADGSFSAYSDLDILIIGPKESIDRSKLSKFDKELNREVQYTIYTYPKWATMKKQKHPFTEEILQKHILILGAQL